ncbi:MAG: NAD(P)H-hydrate dehydratase [Candidatus Cloacimonetes bacterium]|nr:NAD(P)H-hydrate dehydratase [Candidatus Cloacimonadota bacterium]
MIYVLSSAQMKAIDARAINEFGLPARILMENAGKGCADYLLSNYPSAAKERVIILHGSGNNSGDGFVIARWLHLSGSKVALCKVKSGKLSPESQANFELCEKLGILCYDISRDKAVDVFNTHLSSATMIIDAVFGIGFKGELDASLMLLFAATNSCTALRIAIDIPSGTNADSGTGEDAFLADETLCIHSPKLGSLLHTGKTKSGKLHTISLGIPNSYNEAENPAILITDENHATPKRYLGAHKGMYGRVLVMGGSPGFLGSVAMTSRAALRAGAGFVNLLSRKALASYYCCNPAEIMFIGIPESDATNLPDMESCLNLLKQANSLVIGPGLGLDKYALLLLELVLKNSAVPTVVDADALRLIALNPKLQKYLKKPNILLTPHLGEFRTLADITTAQLEENRIHYLQEFVQKHKTRVLLKSDTTVYCDVKNLYLSTAGNDGLATGGSGDVLAGIIASFAAQGMELGKAAINAAFLMGKTAERLALKRQTPSIIPSEIIENLFIKEEI